MTTIHAKGISRRGWLRWTVILGAAAALPGRVWAAVARPEAAFGATALDEAMAALGGALGVIGPDAPRGEGAAHEATDQRGGVGLAGCGGCRDGAFHGHVGSLARSVGRDEG